MKNKTKTKTVNLRIGHRLPIRVGEVTFTLLHPWSHHELQKSNSVDKVIS